MTDFSLNIKNYRFNWGQRTYIMGILNVTPDSFSDGGDYQQINQAVKQALYMIENGADIIDIGGQSTRPGALQISLEEELQRVIPVIEAIRAKSDHPISIDTTRVAVAREAMAKGADFINDISGGTFEPKMFDFVAESGKPIILMHLRGNPQTMQSLTDYNDLMGEIKEFFTIQINYAFSKGVSSRQIILDPGIGFAKNYQQNITILQNIDQLKTLGFPLLIGTSRKSFIGEILQEKDPKKRVWGTGATCYHAIVKGADILRVHDVAEMSQVAKVADILNR
ncbi:MAG: dihydropteroate synthase [Cyanobacterium sp. T60_A2020_053]|nr:dihydropteroate synthase [Cyanobacterium sp. T60_A2020_053]